MTSASSLRLSLFVAGAAPRSRRAIANLNRALAQADHAEVEIIDIYQDPDRTRRSDVVVAPCLVKESPAPPQRLVGDLSDGQRLRALLGIPEEAMRR